MLSCSKVKGLGLGPDISGLEANNMMERMMTMEAYRGIDVRVKRRSWSHLIGTDNI